MYEAKIVEKDIKNGVLHLTVEFTSPNETFREIFTNAAPIKDWVDNVIDERLKQINKVVKFPVTEMSKHPVVETLEADFVEKKRKEKEEKEPKDPKEEVPVDPVVPVVPVEETPKEEKPKEEAPIEPVTP